MNKPNNELFATLHQLAATVTTVFEVLAESKPDVHQADVPTAPSPEPEPKPTQPPAPARSQDDIRRDPVPMATGCLACGRACDGRAARMRHGRLCAVCVGESVDDLQRQSERALSEEIVIDIHKQTSILKKLATVAIDEDGARSLPILEREVLRLCDLFRARRGPFVPMPGLTQRDNDDVERSQRARLEGITRDINDELGVLRKLAAGAIDDDGAHSLPILEREVLRLLNYFRYRQGPFIAATGPTGVVRDDADQAANSSSGLTGAEKA